MQTNNLIFFDGEGMDGNYQTYMPAIKQFLTENKNYAIHLYALKNTINQIKNNYHLANIVYIECEEYISSKDSPLAFRKKNNSTMVKLIQDAKTNHFCPVIMSAGNSGAFILSIAMYLKKLNANNALGFMSIFPTADNSPKVMLDLGSNLNPTAETLLTYANQANLFNQIYFGYDNSKLYLLNNGHEEWKGQKLHQETYSLLKKQTKLNFCGNLEARDILSTDANIILSDGWSANIALKAIEGTANFVMDKIKEAIKSGNIFQKIAGKIIKSPIKKIFIKYNYQQAGGAFILGVERICIKLHGASDTDAFYQSLVRAKTTIDKKLLEKMKNYVN